MGPRRQIEYAPAPKVSSVDDTASLRRRIGQVVCLSWVTFGVFALDALFVLAGSLWQPSSALLNAFFALFFFVLPGTWLSRRARLLCALLSRTISSCPTEARLLERRLLNSELFALALGLLLALIAFSGICSRVFSEQLPVFG